MGICASEQKSGFSSDISYCAAEYRVKDNPGNLQLIWVTIAAAAYCILYSHIVHGKNLINIYWALLAWFSVLIRNKTNQRDRPNSTASFLLPNSLYAILNSLDYFILFLHPLLIGLGELGSYCISGYDVRDELFPERGSCYPRTHALLTFSCHPCFWATGINARIGYQPSNTVSRRKESALRRLPEKTVLSVVNNPVLFPVSFFSSLGDTQDF